MHNKNEKSLLHKRLILRPACLIFSLVLLVSSVLPSWAVTLSANIAAAAEAEALAAAAPMASGSVPYAEAFGKIADPYLGFTDFADSTLEDGRLWTDKSVSANQAIIYDSAGKPVGSETAGEDEFLVALSAMTQAFKEKSEIPTPSDTVLVIDISLSMVTSKVNGISRLSMMIDALNEAITILTMANPENRIAVVAFGGESGKSRVCQILRLESYYKYCDDDPVVPDIPDVPGTSVKQFFSLPSPAFLQVDPNIPKEMLTDGLYRIRANGGTSTQQGIYYGAQQLLKNPDTTFTATLPNNTTTTMTRKPNIVLLTDGEPTLGWTDYKFDRYTSTTADGFDCGNAEDVNMGIEILTVLTATHFKNAVHDYYYGTADTAQTVGFYNIGLGVGGSEDASAVLDPLGETGGEVNASLISKSYSGQVYNMKDALDSFVGSAGTASFPALEKDAERLSQLKLVTVRNTGTKSGRDLNSYDYSDRYITASNGDTLREAFKSVVQHIASSASYTTELGSSENLGNEGDPNYEGLVVFSDVLGEYMEYENFKGIWFDNHEYDGHYFAQRIKNDQNEAFLKEMADIFAGHSQYFGIGQTTAISLLRSAKKAGEKAGAVTDPADKGIYYTNAADYSNRIRYYANADRDWIGNYFNADGTKAAEPANAASIVDLYPVAGVTYNTVGDAPSNVRYSTFRVITALKDGEFAEMESDGTKMVRYLRAGQQMVRWYIPASLIPVRIVSGSGNALQITETVPIRAVYSVGLNEELLTLHEDDASANNNEYGEYKDIDENYEDDPNSETYYFYTNDWNRPSVTGTGRDNQSMVYYTPAGENPYYFYVEDSGANTGKVPLYIYNGTDYEEVTSGAYNSGTTYYAKTMYYDISSGSTEKAQYDAVNHSIIITNDGFPYIKANTAKPAGTQTAKTANATKTDTEAAKEDILALDESGDSVADKQVWRNLLGNNGRLEVKYTGLWVVKEWDVALYSLLDAEKAEAIKTEYVQLYSTISGVEKSVDNPKAFDPTDSAQTVGNLAGFYWSGLPVYEKKVDSGGNTEFIQYTVKEGSYENQVFDPYDEDSETPYFNVTYIQPVWERTTEEMGYARVINSSGYDLRWFMTIEKLFAGIDPAKVGDIEFALYASEDLGQTYVQVDLDYDVTKMTRTYPGGFTDNKFEAVMFAKSGTVQTNPMHFLLVEKGAEVSGYDWTVSLEGNEVKEITEDSHSFKIGTRDDMGNLTEDSHAIVTGDRVFEIKGVDPEEIAYFKLTNNYTPEEPGLTLQKSYNGSGTAAANHDITFIVEGWADEAAFIAKDLTKRIFYDTVSSGLLNYANQTGKAAGKITFPVDQALEHEYAQNTAGYQEVNHPQLLPTGCYYTITEEYDDFVDNGYTYEISTTAVIDDVGGNNPTALPEIDPTAVYPMYGFEFADNDNLSVSLTNAYEQRQRLIIEKVFAGTVPSPIPDDITFTVVQNPGAAENIVKDISYSEFTGGEYIINDLPAGTYEVREEIDGNQAVGYEVTTTVALNGGVTENDSAIEVTLNQSDQDATVTFTNTYAESTANLVIEKKLDSSGHSEDWNVNNQTIFSVVIKDVADPDPSKHSYLIFDGNNKLLGKSATLGGATKLSVSVVNPVTVKGLPIGGQYEVVEQKPGGAVFTTTYSVSDSYTGGQYVSTGSDAGKIMMTTNGGAVKITNLYPSGKGSLIIAKELKGDDAGWGIPSTKTFPVRVFDKDQNGYLLFVETASAGSRSPGGYYRVIGLEKDLAAVSAKPEYQGKVILGELPVSAAGPIVVEVDWPSLGVQSVNYRVEEVVNPGETAYDVTYNPSPPEITLGVASQDNETVTITNTYDNAPGNLNITKRLAGSPGDWGVDGDTIFKAKVKVVTPNGEGDTAGEYLNFKNNVYDGADATGSLIEFSVNNPASLIDIPKGTYAVEEISSGTSYTVSYSGDVTNGEVEIESNQSDTVVVTNTYVHDVGKAIIKKTLSGSYGDWGVNRDTEFTAEVYEKEVPTANERLLYFVKTGANTYRCVGNEEYGPSEPVNGSYLTSITFSENSPALLENLYVGSEYIVKETDDSNASSKTTYYPGNSATLPQDGINAVGNIDITVINTYDSSKNRIIIEKKLDGSYTDWGVDNKTSFKAKIFYEDLASSAPEERLSFEKNPDGSYKCITFGGDTPIPDVSEVEFTQEKSAVLTGLAPGQYRIEENDIVSGAVNDDHYTAAYTDTYGTADDKIVTLTTAQEVTHTVRVTNTYEPGQTLLILEKKLENNEDWGITENTVFHARVKQVDANGPGKDGYIEFARGITATDTYHAVGSGADGFIPKVTDTDYVISFTARQPVILTGLVADRNYVVEEFDPEETSGIETEKIEYQVNVGNPETDYLEVVLSDDTPVTVTVTNTYPEATAKMTIKKVLNQDAGAWGVDVDTVFRAKVVDITDSNSPVTQVFEMTPGGIYRRVSSSYAAGRGSEIIDFSVNQPAKLEGLLPRKAYKVEEESGSNFEAQYAYENDTSVTSITLAENADVTVAVTNNYDQSNSLLRILKDFSGDSRAWDSNREFKVQLYYEDAPGQRNYIKFTKDAKGNYYAENSPVARLFALPSEEAEATATSSATPGSSDPAATGTATPTVVPTPSGDPTATGTATPTVATTPSGNPTTTGTATPTVAPTPSINPEETGTAAPTPADEPAMATPSVIPAATEGPVATDEPVANEIPAATDEPLVTDTPAITKGSAATDISATTDGSVSTDTPEATEKSVVTEAAANAPTPSVIPVAADHFGASGITVRSGSNAALGAVMRSGTRGSVPLSMRGISVRFAGLALSGTGTTLVAPDTTEAGNRISEAGTDIRVNLTDTRNPEAASGLTDTANPEVVSGSGDTTNPGATTNPADGANPGTTPSADTANPGATTIPSGTANPEASAPDSITQPSATSEPADAPDPEVTPDSAVTPGPSGSPAPGTTPDPSGSAAPGATPDPSGTPDPANPDMLSVMAEDVNLLAEAHDTEEYMITLKAGVPVNVFGLTLGYKYAVEEIDVNSREVDPMVEYNGDKDPVELEANEMIEVVISNLYAVPTESLEIKKVLAGSNYASWGVNSATKFPVRIKNVDKNRYLIIGADNYFLELAADEDDLGTTLYVSEISPLIVEGLPVDENYVVEEVVDIGKTFSPTYAGYDAGRTYFTMRDLVGGASTPAITITITNDYPIPRPPDPPAPPAPPNPPGGSTTTVSNPPPEDSIAKVTPSPAPLPDWELPVDENPPTGDTANTSFWLLVLAGAALASLALVLLSRKKAR